MPKSKKLQAWAEMSNMDSKKVHLNQILLDPNNPRLEISGKVRIPDARITEPSIQKDCLDQIRKEGVTDLTESIQTSGFWMVDRIVLRPLGTDRYVVVEGNRRVAALQTLKESYDKGKIPHLDRKIYNGILEFEALAYKGSNNNIAWIIQGFRHTPGIKSWKRYPQAKFFSDFEKERRKTPQEIASIFGIKPTKIVTHSIRSYHAFEQAKQDEDYGEMLGPDKFGHFDEIILAKEDLKEWMGWDDTQRKFTKVNNLKKYLSWAISEEGEKPKIDISATARDVLPKLIQPENKKLFEKFEKGDLNINQCEEELLKEETKREAIDVSDVIKSLEEMKRMINTLPVPQLQRAKSGDEKTQKVQLIKLLQELSEILRLQIKNLQKK